MVDWKGQGYAFWFLILGATAFVLGVILLIVSFVTGISLSYGLYLIAIAAVAVIIGSIIRITWERYR